MMCARIPKAYCLVFTDLKARAVHIVPNPNDEGHATTGRKCFCHPDIEKCPTLDIFTHNRGKVGRA